MSGCFLLEDVDELTPAICLRVRELGSAASFPFSEERSIRHAALQSRTCARIVGGAWSIEGVATHERPAVSHLLRTLAANHSIRVLDDG